MGKIIWLASYPKSGNTWVRAFLANYISNTEKPFPINELSNFTLDDMRMAFYEKAANKPVSKFDAFDPIRLRPMAQRALADSFEVDLFVKTHSQNIEIGDVPQINAEVTAGVIYIVRNPLDLAVSYSSYYGKTIDTSIEELNDTSNTLRPRGLFCRIGKWSDHVSSWLENNNLPTICIKYEDLSNNPDKHFGRIISELGFELDSERLRRAIRFSSFNELSKQEKQLGFVEKPPTADENFFRNGVTNNWECHLNSSQRKRLEQTQGEMMQKLGYFG